LGSLSDYSEGKLLDHIFNVQYSSVATVYVGLWTATLSDASTGATAGEVSTAGTAYARTAITFGAAASRMVIQSGAVTFPPATASWARLRIGRFAMPRPRATSWPMAPLRPPLRR